MEFMTRLFYPKSEKFGEKVPVNGEPRQGAVLFLDWRSGFFHLEKSVDAALDFARTGPPSSTGIFTQLDGTGAVLR